MIIEAIFSLHSKWIKSKQLYPWGWPFNCNNRSEPVAGENCFSVDHGHLATIQKLFFRSAGDRDRSRRIRSPELNELKFLTIQQERDRR
jgi:hypothetical protein